MRRHKGSKEKHGASKHPGDKAKVSPSTFKDTSSERGRWQSRKGFLDYFPWIWVIAGVLEIGFELLRFALVSTTLCCWWSSAPWRSMVSEFVADGNRRAWGGTCLIDWLRTLVVLGDELRVFLLVVNEVESPAVAAILPVVRGRLARCRWLQTGATSAMGMEMLLTPCETTRCRGHHHSARQRLRR